MSFCDRRLVGASCYASLLLLSAALVFAADNPALKGYADYEAFSSQIAKLAESKMVAATSLGKTLGGREIHLLTIGTGKVDAKPAILIVGNVHGPHLAGSELALRTARQLVEKSASDKKVKALLDQFTVYVIPRPSPDASEKCFLAPLHERAGNARKTDDDRDFAVGEDPADDLNGDGWITVMRVHDETGPLMSHPDDPRVLIKADPKKNERGKYRLYVEGRDDDGDGQFNEDGGEGVSFNRNFTFKYPYFKQGAGPNQVSEVETRAVADFAFDHPNIAAVFTFSPNDNLMQPWKANAQAERSRIKTTLMSADLAYQDFVAARFGKSHGGKNAPPSPAAEGSFSHWAYFHYGRWSWSTRGWWIPKTDPPKDAKKPSGEKRGAADINTLTWFAKEKIDGFVDWKPVKHPGFPDRKVEVGGFKPFYRLNPPAKLLDGLATKHVEFLTGLPELAPRVEIQRVKSESLGGGVFRVTSTVINKGYLPTMTEMGRINRHAYPLQLALELPKTVKYLQGSPRTELSRLDGNGGNTEKTWLVRIPAGKPVAGKLKVWAPTVNSHEVKIELK